MKKFSRILFLTILFIGFQFSSIAAEKVEYLKTADLIFDVSNQGRAANIKIADNIATTPKSLSGTDLKIA